MTPVRFGGAGLKPCRECGRRRTAAADGGNRCGTAAFALCAFGALLLTGCNTTAPPKPLNQLTAQEAAGHAAFQQNCARCHDDRDGAAKQGPTLLGVYKKPYLPSGAPANDDRITNVILHGRGMMPALGGAMAPGDIDNLLAYLKTL